MGCDIHLHIELLHKDGRWLHYAAPNVDRDYRLFSKLAGVRNGFEIEPISKPKGIPQDASEITRSIWDCSGEHTPSWLSSDEVLELEEWLKEEFEIARNKNDNVSCLDYNLEFSIINTYLDGNSFTAFKKYDDFPYIPEPFVDFRFVFWFDS